MKLRQQIKQKAKRMVLLRSAVFLACWAFWIGLACLTWTLSSHHLSAASQKQRAKTCPATKPCGSYDPYTDTEL